jgi:thiol-disulfide isomerase/thioredoxin
MRKIVLTVLLVCVSFSVYAQTTTSKASLDLKDINGKRLNLADYKGKVVLVNFWGTWCAPCRKEIPDLIKLQRKYRSQGLQIAGITYPPEQRYEVLRFARRYRMNYRVALGTQQTKTLLTSSQTLPVTVIIDRDGTVRDVIEGIMYADEFDEKVKPLLTTLAELTPESADTSGEIQRATIKVTGAGYEPSSVTLRRGKPAELTFVRTIERTCGREIVIPGYGIKQSLPLNVPVSVTFTPRQSGRFKFTCGMDMFRGTLVVR